MIIQTKQQFDFINMVANRLAENFSESLFVLNKEKSYAAHIDCLAEILDWSWEFYDQFYDKINNWEIFKWSSDNIYDAVTLDDLIVAFGQDRVKKFYYQIRKMLPALSKNIQAL